MNATNALSVMVGATRPCYRLESALARIGSDGRICGVARRRCWESSREGLLYNKYKESHGKILDARCRRSGRALQTAVFSPTRLKNGPPSASSSVVDSSLEQGSLRVRIATYMHF